MKDRGKPVDTVEFWKTRIGVAEAAGNLRHSVFRAPEEMWIELNNDHKNILNEIINPDDRILDAGCGYGRASEFIPVDSEVGGGYTGVDQSPDFIWYAKNYYPKHTFYCEDLTKLSFDDNQFDWSICISVMIMVVQNLGWFAWEEIQNELLRVSQCGIICLEYGKADTKTSSDTYYLIKKTK